MLLPVLYLHINGLTATEGLIGCCGKKACCFIASLLCFFSFFQMSDVKSEVKISWPTSLAKMSTSEEGDRVTDNLLGRTKHC